MSIDIVRDFLSTGWVPGIWQGMSVITCVILLLDLQRNNNYIGRLMKVM